MDEEKKFNKEPEDIHCLAFFRDGKCPKWRYKGVHCPLNVVYNGYKYCCMDKDE